jgi:hypothetical protein
MCALGIYLWSQSNSESKPAMLRPTVSRQVCLGVRPDLGLKLRLFLLSIAGLYIRDDHSSHLQFLLASPSQSFLHLSHCTHGYIFSLRRDSPNLRVRSLYLYLPGAEWHSYTFRHCIPFSSLRTACGRTVELFKTPSTRAVRLLGQA